MSEGESAAYRPNEFKRPPRVPDEMRRWEPTTNGMKEVVIHPFGPEGYKEDVKVHRGEDKRMNVDPETFGNEIERLRHAHGGKTQKYTDVIDEAYDNVIHGRLGAVPSWLNSKKD